MKGILFTPSNHQAIRDKLKTQTRRLDHLKEINKAPDKWVWAGTTFGGYAFGNVETQQIIIVKSPYRVGDIVYIKEALRKDGRLGDTCYDDENMTPVFRNGIFGQLVKWQWQGYKLSPLFMPAWAARTFIKITDVRPERLQTVTIADCRAEGLSSYPHEDWKVANILKFWQGRFEDLWDSINGKKYPFAGNYWTWRNCFNLKVG